MNKKYGRGTGNIHPVDIHVGGQIKRGRENIGLSQVKLATSLNLTFQQIQKYETGKNRVSCSMLIEISKILGFPISYFFPDQGSTSADVLSERIECMRGIIDGQKRQLEIIKKAAGG